jgi:hypothetical protein
MTRLKTIGSALILLSSFSLALGQQEGAKAINVSPSPVVTAGSSAERVRFAAPGTVVQMRLQVYSDTAQTVFDATSKGNVLDWTVQDGTGARLVEGKYVCVVTIKSLSGKLSQRIGEVVVQGHETQQREIDPTQLISIQREEVGPMEDNASIVALRNNEPESAAVIAHNGEEGQVTRSGGALSFRMGDFFRGRDTEQMRLTAEGNLGIGITNPQVRLEVDGSIRASKGIVFPDGSVQVSAARKTFGGASLMPGQSKQTHAQGQEHLSPETTGTGTTGKIAKWQDGPGGVLGDSLITEAGGNIGINTPPDPRFKLDVLGYNRFRAPNASFYLTGFKPGGNDWVFQTVDDNGRFRIWGGDNATGAERLAIQLDTGNVGIGTTSPGAKLHVAGPMRAGSLRWGGTTTAPPYVYSDEDGSGLFMEQVGTAAANSRMRLQSSVTGAQASYSQFFIDPANGFSFVSDGTANGNVGIGTTSPTTKLDIGGGMRATSGIFGSIAFGTTTGVVATGASGTNGGDGVEGIGANGFGTGGRGVVAFGGAAASSAGFGGDGVVGVRGTGNTDGRAGFFTGNVSIAGTLSKGSGSFKIDHPLDPANKYLYHSFVESPDMMNIYNGNIISNEKGEATVTLPEYFEALNRDFRYQLTVIGTVAQAIVADKVKNNRFIIKTTEPNVEVSWQVTGIRKDAFANRHRIPVEVDKPDNERGFYVYPELFNQSEERSVEWVRNPELMRRIKEQREQAQQKLQKEQ